MAALTRTLRARLVSALGISAIVTLAACPPATVAAAPSIGGCPVFPANNVWNTDVSSLPVHPSSATWLGSMGGPSVRLHPDFGPSGGFPYGIPFNVVDGTHPKINLAFDYSGESDHVSYPFGADTSIEGGPGAGGDRHAIMVDRTNCTLYELYNAHWGGAAGSTAGSGATWALGGNALRPATWTSADAAGLPIFPGLLRLEEVQAGVVQHAIRFTAQRTDRSFVWPARHQAGAAANPALPPMGARFRLRAGFDVSRFSASSQVVLNAMKHYGLLLADNGSNWYFQGAAENGWSDTMIGELKTVPAGQFDALDESSLMIDPNSAQARQPGGAPASTRGSGPPVQVAAALPPDPPAPIPSASASTAVTSAVERAGRRDAGLNTSIPQLASGHPQPAARQPAGISIFAWLVVALELGVVGSGVWLLRSRWVGWLSGSGGARSGPP
ncbi:MAG TPA: hypothetical protein VN863_03895 [Candidatus Dormibacteraeota bacterium]|nr:hypothetical protein [Candidatus Dormibacteraeota bacterium]